MSNKVDKLGARVGKLEPGPPRDVGHDRWKKVVSRLSPDEQAALSRAIMALEKSDGCASLETLPEDQKAAWIRATKLFEEQKP